MNTQTGCGHGKITVTHAQRLVDVYRSDPDHPLFLEYAECILEHANEVSRLRKKVEILENMLTGTQAAMYSCDMTQTKEAPESESEPILDTPSFALSTSLLSDLAELVEKVEDLGITDELTMTTDLDGGLKCRVAIGWDHDGEFGIIKMELV